MCKPKLCLLRDHASGSDPAALVQQLLACSHLPNLVALNLPDLFTAPPPLRKADGDTAAVCVVGHSNKSAWNASSNKTKKSTGPALLLPLADVSCRRASEPARVTSRHGSKQAIHYHHQSARRDP